MKSVASAPDEVFYHFAKQTQSIDVLIHTLYTTPSQVTVDHFKAVNSHLLDDKVQIGQLVIITPPNSIQCSSFEADMMDAAALVDQRIAELTAEDKRILAENYQLLNNITSVGGAGYGATLTYFSHHVKNIEGILKQIEQLYVKTYNSTSHLKSSHFHLQRKQLFMRLDMTMKSFVGEARAGFNYNYAGIKNGLGLSTKSIVHQWKNQPGNVTNIEGFSKNYDKVAKLSKTLKGAGYAGIALDVGQSGVKIHEACTIGTNKECTKSKFKEGGRITGSVGGGIAGGALASYVTCNLLFGLETAGTSLLWCGIVAGVAGGYAGGNLTGSVTGDIGEAIYETTYQ